MATRVVLNANGLRVSKAGRDANSANYDDLLFDSSRIVSRALMSGTVGDGTTSVAHNLGYRPITFVSVVVPPPSPGYGGGQDYDSCSISITTSAVVFTLRAGMAANYIIFYDQWK